MVGIPRVRVKCIVFSCCVVFGHHHGGAFYLSPHVSLCSASVSGSVGN